MNERASILLNISSFSSSGAAAGKVGPSAPTHLGRLIGEALARSLYRREGLESLGRQLAALARHAYFAREMETVEQASRLMLELPLSEGLKSVAHYYQAISAWKQNDISVIRQRLESILETAAPPQRAQALLSLGAAHFGQGRFEAALPLYLDAARAAGRQDLLVYAAAQKMAAVVRGVSGDHGRALAGLEGLLPAALAAARQCPAFYYEYLNSYAVELGEAGRLGEAQRVCAVTLASPFASAYPEFAQTRDELAARRTAATPSVIAVPAALALASRPQPQAAPEPAPARARAIIALKLRRACSRAAVLAMADAVVVPSVSPHPILDQFVECTLPRGPPALS
jgi:tetratricopeptide (TPR) repeat protein